MNKYTAIALLLTALPATASVKHHKTHRSFHAVVRHQAAPGMSTERATEIQTALIQKGYLSGEPTGTWDASSIAAMQRLQSDNGWQTRITPDARGLNKLGLGAQPATTPKP